MDESPHGARLLSGVRMDSSVNLTAVIVADAMGLTILFAVALGNYWRTQTASARNRPLLIMFFTSALSCIFDIMCFAVDGKPGVLNHFLSVTSNSIMFICSITISVAWPLLVATHLDVKLARIHKAIIAALCGTGAVLLLINLFTPVVFRIDTQNIYYRGDAYWFFLGTELLMIADGLILYFYARRKSGGLKFFPAWAFMIPSVAGVLVQAFIYGISTAVPASAISIGCITAAFQNELLFQDKLTGLYNRYYLNSLEKKLSKIKGEYTAMMLDVNHFKAVNDTHGHRAGDRVLQDLAGILRTVVGAEGEVIRYAGDEFIIILNTKDEQAAEATIGNIDAGLEEYNRNSDHPYNLSVAVGYCHLNFQKNTMDELLDKIDRLMYRDKRDYYRQHTERDRRARRKEPIPY